MKQRRATLVQLLILGVLGAAVLISLMLPSSGLFTSSGEVVEISVIFREVDAVHWENTKMGMEQAAQEAGAELRFLYLTRPNDAEEQIEIMRREAVRGAQALIVIPVSDACVETLSKEQSDLPIISMESCAPGAAACIAPDQAALGSALAQEIIEDGIPNQVLLLDTAKDNSAVTQRLDAAQAALEEQGAAVARMKISAEEIKAQSFLWGQEVYDAVVVAEPFAAQEAAEKKAELGLSKRLYGVGITDAIALALEDETISACAVIGEYASGYLAVQQALRAVSGKDAQSQTMPFSIVRGEDFNELSSQKLLFPVD